MKRDKRVKSPDKTWLRYPDETVDVSIRKDTGHGSRWRVAVWDCDDTGYELTDLDIVTAFRVYRSILDGITTAKLRSLGFVRG